MRWYFWIGFWVGYWLPSAAAQAPQLTIRLSADTVLIGERFTLTLVVERDAGWQLEAPTDSLLGDLYVVGTPLHRSYPAGPGRLRDSLVYTVTTFALDTARVPALSLRLRTETEHQTLHTPPLRVVVRSIVPPDASGIRALAPIVDFPAPQWPWLLGLAVVALLLGLAVYFWRRRGQQPPSVPLAARNAASDPYEVALKHLEALKPLADQIPVKPFYVGLTETLRGYLEDRLGLAARKMTTRELIAHLQRYPLPTIAALAEPLRQVFEAADLAKFACREYPPAYNHHMLAVTHTLLERLERTLAADRLPPSTEPS